MYKKSIGFLVFMVVFFAGSMVALAGNGDQIDSKDTNSSSASCEEGFDVTTNSAIQTVVGTPENMKLADYEEDNPLEKSGEELDNTSGSAIEALNGEYGENATGSSIDTEDNILNENDSDMYIKNEYSQIREQAEDSYGDVFFGDYDRTTGSAILMGINVVEYPQSDKELNVTGTVLKENVVLFIYLSIEHGFEPLEFVDEKGYSLEETVQSRVALPDEVEEAVHIRTIAFCKQDMDNLVLDENLQIKDFKVMKINKDDEGDKEIDKEINNVNDLLEEFKLLDELNILD